ncbi:hypothetical protein SDC9_207498 [bioreactor metagenome]|uniref:Uncharacterized protein n=1 Tax=bioreactor metagenome TaxID=1076179 RepID=A0A645J8M5_9ZZZZ
MGVERLCGIILTTLFDPQSEAMQIITLQIVQQRLLLFTPTVMHINALIAEQHFNLADLDTVVDPAFYLTDPIDIRVVKQAMSAVCPLRFQ